VREYDAAGEIRWAKSVRERVDLARLRRTEVESAASDCFRSALGSNDLNAVAKPTSRTYQSVEYCRGKRQSIEFMETSAIGYL
jgi:hypothetical protein